MLDVSDMGSPAKRRKLNNASKSSPAVTRNLDFFFVRQNQGLSVRPSDDVEQKTGEPRASPELTDEQLARKLQEEWDQEDAERAAPQSSRRLETESQDIPDEKGNDTKSKNSEVTEQDGNGDGIQKGSQNTPNFEPESHPPESKGKNTLSLQSAGSAEDMISSNIQFDQSPLTFEPSEYIPDLQSHWAAEGGNASYAILTRCFMLVNSTQSRIKIVDTLVNLLRVIIEGDPSSLLPTVSTNISLSLFLFISFDCIQQ